MAKKDCVICGEAGYMYFPFCYKHLMMKNSGKVEKCNDCDTWYIKADGCTCKKNDLSFIFGKDVATENKCTKCGKHHSGKYDLCYDCYNNKSPMQKVIIGKTETTETGDIRKKWEAGTRCNDGHYVRSRSEALIDNWLYDNRIVHAYEKSVYMKTAPDVIVLSDFYIPEGKVYIEFWGLDNEKYKQRKEEKIRLYEENGYNLINLHDEDIKRLDDVLPKHLGKYIK